MGSPCVRIVDSDGNWVMLEDRIKELQSDPRFHNSIPNPTKIARGDESGLRDDFEQIARGDAVVE